MESQTIMLESIFTAVAVEAKERRDVVTMNLPGSFIHIQKMRCSNVNEGKAGRVDDSHITSDLLKVHYNECLRKKFFTCMSRRHYMVC